MRFSFFKAAESLPPGLPGAVLRERSDLRKKLRKGKVTAQTIDDGKNAFVVAIGDEIFKAPRLPQDIAAFKEELATQQLLSGKGLPVPDVTYTGKHSVFFGMKRLPGVTLHDVRAEITPEQKRILAQDLADAIIRMAKILPMKYGRFAQHGDMHSLNILVDPVTKKLTGIIDFANLQYLGKDYLADVPLIKDIKTMVKEEYTRRKSEIPDPPAKIANKSIPPNP